MSVRPPAPPSPTAHLLPVYQHETELLAALRQHQVVVVEGPTGCGKTTQIPQMLLRAGITDRMIGVTQPRRIAAVSVSWRIAEEQAVRIGAEVGFAIRFDDQTSPETRIKIMTDGILLQEARSDPDFSRYGVLVVDEAHERSLNIDFLLGLLHGVLARRPDLRVLVSSATLQPERFVRFFEDRVGRVPVVSIDARPHPVETVWRPMYSDAPQDLAEAIADEVAGIHRSGHPGHVLVFLSGEDGIRRTGAAIGRRGLGRDLVVLPLYGALTREEQERVFEPFAGKRKVILSTNIAETSITIDDTRFVIDSGLAKVPRVSNRTGITLLREEGISRASADQRLGRAGRTAPGKCIRMYAERDYQARPPYTDEEILRLDLAETVLRLIDLGIHDVEAFPFPTVPQRSRLRAALETLYQLGAIDQRRYLTPVGKRMVPFPLTPPLARMVVEAAERFPHVVDDVLLYAAFLSGRSPFAYPPGHEDAARKAHEGFAHPLGDALAAIRACRAWAQADDPEAFCRRHFLDGNLMAFIAKSHRQLRDITWELGVPHEGASLAHGGEAQEIVRCVAAGFAGNLLHCRGRYFEGPGEDKIFLHPSSALYGETPRFAVAADITIAARPYARQVSVVRAAWVPELRPDLAERYHLDAERLQRGEGRPPAAPTTLQLGPVTLEVDQRKGKPRVELPYEALDELKQLRPEDVPPEAARYQARVLVPPYAFAQGTPLGVLLAILPHLPLPEPNDPLKRSVPEGALLEVDRNLHTLQRHLPDLLQPMLSSHGRKPGWVMIVANGGGGYWYEIGMDWREVLEVSALSLEDLAGHLEEDDPAFAAVQAALERVRPRLEALLAALAGVKKGRRG